MLTPKREKLAVAVFASPVLLGVVDLAWVGVDFFVREDPGPGFGRFGPFELSVFIIAAFTLFRLVANALVVSVLHRAIGSLAWGAILLASATGALISSFLEIMVPMGIFAMASFSCGVTAVCFGIAIRVSPTGDRSR